MAKRNTRRTVSMSARTFVRLRKACIDMEVSMAGKTEELIAAWLDSIGEPDVDQQVAKATLHGEEIRRASARPPNLPPQIMEL